jgi:predicted ATPase/class 3 adenylate cyclase
VDGHTEVVSFLFTDIVGSTRRWAASETAMAADLDRHDALVAGIIAEHGGMVFKVVGDAFHASFGDPAAAVRAAVEIDRRLPDQAWEADPIEVRAVIHTGSAHRRDDDYLGLSLSLASRLLALAAGGQILVSDATAALVETTTDFSLRRLGRVGLRDIARPVAVHQVVADGVRHDFPPLVDPEGRMRGFPLAAGVFVGREREMAETLELLSHHRLLTLVGPGGSGKTRLGTRLVSNLTGDFDSLWFVDLAPVSRSDLIAETIAQAVAPTGDGDPLELAIAGLQDGRHLLMLDNLEHLSGAAGIVNRLLTSVPELRILATSRAPLRLRSEQRYPLPPLPVEGEDAEAIRLFVERARQADPGFVLDHDDLEAVKQICRLVDGLPLGIELAAARIRLFPPQDLAERLSAGTSSSLLGGAADLPGRHRSLEAAVAWSVDLLDEAHVRLFRRMGVFAGGAGLEAVQAVCADPGDDVLLGLERLVDHSLVRSLPGRFGPRFGMLETIRANAAERLRSSREADDVCRRHAEYFASLVEKAEPYLRSDEQRYWFARLDEELPNLRAAVEWSFGEENGRLGLSIITNSTDYLFYQGIIEGDWRRWTDLARSRLDGLDPQMLGMVHLALGRYAFMRFELEEARAHNDLAIEHLQRSGDRRHLVLAHVGWASTGLGIPDLFEEAVGHARRAVALGKELGLLALVAQGLNIWGELFRLQGDLDESIRIQERARKAAVEAGEETRVAMLDHNLGIMAYLQGEPTAGRRLLSSVDLALDGDYVNIGVWSLLALAGPVAEVDPATAARMIGAHNGIRERLRMSPQVADRHDYETIVSRVRETAGENFVALESEGRRLDLRAAADLARAALGGA